MTIERKEELRKLLLKISVFSGCAVLGFSIGRCARNASTEDESNNTKTYYAAPIAMTNKDGETTYAAPSGFTLAYDEDGKLYCYKTIIINDSEIKTLKKSK